MKKKRLTEGQPQLAVQHLSRTEKLWLMRLESDHDKYISFSKKQRKILDGLVEKGLLTMNGRSDDKYSYYELTVWAAEMRNWWKREGAYKRRRKNKLHSKSR